MPVSALVKGLRAAGSVLETIDGVSTDSKAALAELVDKINEIVTALTEEETGIEARLDALETDVADHETRIVALEGA